MKWFLIVLLTLLLVVGLIATWNKLQYFTPNPIIPHKKVLITLPYSEEYEATSLIPMGETIAHDFYGGHPGIDFQWDHSVPLIAVADGKITSITKADDMGEPVIYLTLKFGEYMTVYKELEKVEAGIKRGLKVKKGDIIGYPHCVERVENNGFRHTNCQLHWEFGYNMLTPGFERLCPMTYFDPDARSRIEKLWESVPANDQFKKAFPNICSNIYLGRDQ